MGCSLFLKKRLSFVFNRQMLGASVVDFIMGVLISIAFMLVVAKFAMEMYYSLR